MNHRYPDGSTPVHLSLKTKVKIFQAVLSSGGDHRIFLHRDHLALDSSAPALCLSVRSGTLVPTLCAAVETGSVDMVAACLDAGCDIRSRVTPGDMTALHLACSLGDAAVVALLLQRGADPEAVDSQGKRPRDLAADGSVKKVLRDHANRHAPRVKQGSSGGGNTFSPFKAEAQRVRAVAEGAGASAGAGAGSGSGSARAASTTATVSVAFTNSDEVNVASLVSMGYDEEDVRYVIGQFKQENRHGYQLDDAIDSLANLDVLREEIDDHEGQGSAHPTHQAPQAQEQQHHQGDGKYEYFIHSVTDQHYVTYLTSVGARYYIVERPGNREWQPFPSEWDGAGFFCECEDDPGQIDPFEFEPAPLAKSERYQIFTPEGGNGERLLTCLVDGKDRYYAVQETDEWKPFPEDWQGTFKDMAPKSGDSESGEDAGTADDNEEDIIRPTYAICVYPDGTRHTTCMVDGTLYLADGRDWTVFPNAMLPQVRFERVPTTTTTNAATTAAATPSAPSTAATPAAAASTASAVSEEEKNLVSRIQAMLKDTTNPSRTI